MSEIVKSFRNLAPNNLAAPSGNDFKLQKFRSRTLMEVEDYDMQTDELTGNATTKDDCNGKYVNQTESIL